MENAIFRVDIGHTVSQWQKSTSGGIETQFSLYGRINISLIIVQILLEKSIAGIIAPFAMGLSLAAIQLILMSTIIKQSLPRDNLNLIKWKKW